MFFISLRLVDVLTFALTCLQTRMRHECNFSFHPVSVRLEITIKHMQRTHANRTVQLH